MCRLIVVKLPMMATCETPTRELYLASVCVNFGWSGAYHKRNWPNWLNYIEIMWAGSSAENETLVSSTS